MLFVMSQNSSLANVTVGNQNGSFRRKYAFPVPFGGKKWFLTEENGEGEI